MQINELLQIPWVWTKRSCVSLLPFFHEKITCSSNFEPKLYGIAQPVFKMVFVPFPKKIIWSYFHSESPYWTEIKIFFVLTTELVSPVKLTMLIRTRVGGSKLFIVTYISLTKRHFLHKYLCWYQMWEIHWNYNKCSTRTRGRGTGQQNSEKHWKKGISGTKD